MAEPGRFISSLLQSTLFFLQFRKAMKEISNPIVSQNEIKSILNNEVIS